MELFQEGKYHYLNGELYCEQVAIEEIVEKVGTPLYIYSKNYFIDRYKEFEDAFKNVKHSIFYSCKANSNLNVMKIISDLGCGIDAYSGGEVFRALKIGVDPKKIMIAGVGKTTQEIKFALENNLKMIKAESSEEIQLINRIASDMNVIASVAIRVNPDVDAKTHPYISTGLAENKFGISMQETEEILSNFAGYTNILFTGLDMHIGSQITKIDPYVEATGKMVNFYKKMTAKGVPLAHLDLGGGIGTRYKDEKVFSPKELANAITGLVSDLDCELIFEPGRYLSANAGVLVTEVLYTKKNNKKNFIIVDAAMTELIRPSLYKAFHHIQPIMISGERPDIKADIVGPVCESSDFLAKDRVIQQCRQGDKLAVMTAGAYGMIMSSNYNQRRRPPEVIVDGDKFFITRSRESYEHLLWDEEIVGDLFKK
jgi:diaminopimelate decarboxylase